MWTIIIIILVIVITGFLISVDKDNQELNIQPMHEKFAIIIQLLNDTAFDGNGKTNLLSNKEITIYEDGSNQIIRLQYSTGHLSLIWKFKYFQKELIYQRQFNDLRNISIFQQKNIANIAIDEMENKVLNFKANVLGEI